MAILNANSARIVSSSICPVAAIFLGISGVIGDTKLVALDAGAGDLPTIDLGSAGLGAGAVSLTYHAPTTSVPDTSLAAWDTAAGSPWTIDTAAPLSSTLVGGGNAGIHAEIEYRNSVIYGTDTDTKNLSLIDPFTCLIFDDGFESGHTSAWSETSP